jgi:bacteriocin-like protein
MFKKQGTSKRSASTSIGDREPGFGSATTPTDMNQQASAFDMAWASEEQELSEEELATVVGGSPVLTREMVQIIAQGGVSRMMVQQFGSALSQALQRGIPIRRRW